VCTDRLLHARGYAGQCFFSVPKPSKRLIRAPGPPAGSRGPRPPFSTLTRPVIKKIDAPCRGRSAAGGVFGRRVYVHGRVCAAIARGAAVVFWRAPAAHKRNALSRLYQAAMLEFPRRHVRDRHGPPHVTDHGLLRAAGEIRRGPCHARLNPAPPPPPPRTRQSPVARGRHMNTTATFGTTTGVDVRVARWARLSRDDFLSAIVGAPVSGSDHLHWRNTDLDFVSACASCWAILDRARPSIPDAHTARARGRRPLTLSPLVNMPSVLRPGQCRESCAAGEAWSNS